MIKINNNTQDLVLQVEEYTNINRVVQELNLYINEVLIVCPELFFQRFIQYFYSISEFNFKGSMSLIEDSIVENDKFISIGLVYNSKPFKFNFIITHTELKTINHPINGSEEYKVGFNIIDIK